MNAIFKYNYLMLEEFNGSQKYMHQGKKMSPNKNQILR